MDFSSWDKLQTKYKIMLFGVTVLIVAYMLYTFLLVPQWAHIDDLKNQNATLQQQVKVVQNFAIAHPNPEGYILELDSKIMESNMLLPDNPDVSSVLLQLEQLAEQCGVQLSYLKPGKTDNKQGYREIVLDFSIKGNFPDIMNFLHKTENEPRFISVANISMQVKDEGLESKMLAKIYSYGVTAPAAPPIVPPVAPKK